jgi:antitoxin ParD1/3/4
MASQSTLNISLPESMRKWVEHRVDAEGYGTVSEYVRALIREDQRVESRDQIDRKLIDALDGGDAVEMTAKDWQEIRSAVRQRLAAKAKRK